MIKESFGEKLTRLLKENKMTQGDLIRKTGFCSATVSSYCNDRYMPSEKRIKMIADVFGLSTKELVQDIHFVIKRYESYVAFGANLQKILREKEMTKVELGKMVGVTGSTVSNYISGKATPCENTLKRIVKALNVTREELLHGVDFGNLKKFVEIKCDDYPKMFFKDLRDEAQIKPEPLADAQTEPCIHHVPVTPVPKKYPTTLEDLESVEIDFTPMKSIPMDVRIPKSSIIPNQKTCTKCMYDNVTDCIVNSMFSYSPDTIQKWARRSICRMTDVDSLDYDPDRAILIQEMLFKFFINKKKPLRPDSRYFIREKDGEMFLKRNKGELDTLHNYSISRRDENGETHVTRMVMSEAEKAKVEDILNELSIDFVVRDLADILK